MPSNHLILCHPLLLPPSIFPSIRVFSNEWCPKYWSFGFSRPVGSQRVRHDLVTEQQQSLSFHQSQFLGRREGTSGSGWRTGLWRGVPSPPRASIPESSQPKEESGLAGSAPGHRAPGDGRGRCPQGFGSRVGSPSRQPRVRSSRVGMGAFRRPEPGLRPERRVVKGPRAAEPGADGWCRRPGDRGLARSLSTARRMQ